jgi:hypothetical protein
MIRSYKLSGKSQSKRTIEALSDPGVLEHVGISGISLYRTIDENRLRHTFSWPRISNLIVAECFVVLTVVMSFFMSMALAIPLGLVIVLLAYLLIIRIPLFSKSLILRKAQLPLDFPFACVIRYSGNLTGEELGKIETDYGLEWISDHLE